MLGDIKLKEIVSIIMLSIIIIVINLNPLVVNGAVYGVSSAIEKYRVDYITNSYMTQTSEHFVIKYTQKDNNNIKMIIDDAEQSFSKLCEIFKYTSNEKLTIIVFADNKSMNEILKLPQYQKSMGLYYSDFISILSPDVWIPSSKDKKAIFEAKGPILHELVHYFIDKKTNGNYPRWFTEGVALYFEKEFLGFEINSESDMVYTIDELNNNFEQLDQDAAYKNSYEIISRYIKTYGIDRLLNITKMLGAGYYLEEFRNL